MSKQLISEYLKKNPVQAEVYNYLKDCPGSTETRILEQVFNINRKHESNKRGADCIRRAQKSGIIFRYAVSNKRHKFEWKAYGTPQDNVPVQLKVKPKKFAETFDKIRAEIRGNAKKVFLNELEIVVGKYKKFISPVDIHDTLELVYQRSKNF